MCQLLVEWIWYFCRFYSPFTLLTWKDWGLSTKPVLWGADDRETHTDECEKRNATSRADSPSCCIAETQARSKLTAPARRQSWTVRYSAPLLAVSIILCEFPRAACLLFLTSLIVCKSSKGRGTRMVHATERYLLYFSFFPAIKNLNTDNSLKQQQAGNEDKFLLQYLKRKVWARDHN